MKVLFDTNVILDVLLDRKPFSDTASYLFSEAENSEIIEQQILGRMPEQEQGCCDSNFTGCPLASS